MFGPHQMSRLGVAALAGLIGSILGSSAANAQNRRMMVVEDDNGGGSFIQHFSLPNVMELREPDFVRSDLPIFQEKLILSEEQTAAIKRQIEIYLEALAKLTEELLSFPGAEPMVVLGGKAMIDAKVGPGAIVIAPSNSQDLPELTLEDLDEMPGMGMEAGVMVTAPMGEGGGEDGDEGEGAGERPRIAVSFQSRDDEELPEKVRQELEKRAQELAEKIAKQIDGQVANGGPGAGAVPPLPGAEEVEKFHQRKQEIEKAAKSFRKAKSQLRTEFVAEAQSGLSAPQLERWPALERALLRERTLPKGRLCGERTDLFNVMKNLEVPATADTPMAAQLDSYDLELDAALRQRNALLDESFEKINKAMQEKDFERALQLIDRTAAARVAVRSVNERYACTIAELLPGETASTFRQTIEKNAYPQIHRRTFGDKTFAAAKGLEALDETTRASISELEAAYRTERAEADARLRRAIDKHQPGEPRRPIERMKTMMNNPEARGPGMMIAMNDEDPVREAMAKRRELDERYAKSVAALLTPEQREQLPKPPAKRAPGEPIIIH